MRAKREQQAKIDIHGGEKKIQERGGNIFIIKKQKKEFDALYQCMFLDCQQIYLK